MTYILMFLVLGCCVFLFFIAALLVGGRAS